MEIPVDIKDVVFNTAIRTGDSNQWNYLLQKFKTTKVDSDRQKYLTALSVSEDEIILRNFLNMTINPEESGIRIQDISFIYGIISNNKVGRVVAMGWLNENYDEILNNLGEGGGEAGGGGFSRLVSVIIGQYGFYIT